jgi:hypothetical protein
MPTAFETIDTAIKEVTKARNRVSKIKMNQVRRADDLDMLKSTAFAWFNTHRSVVASNAPSVDLARIDAPYQRVLDSADRYAAKKTYLDSLKNAKTALVAVRAKVVGAPVSRAGGSMDDLAPDFSPLAGNEPMRNILTRRWHECRKCVEAEAHLAAIVMMGGMLEALFVARANKMPDKNPLIKAASAPKEKSTGKTLNYQDWMLDSYIQVAHELRWITESAMNVADVLKEYRNYIHPAKELRHGVILGLNDSRMFWHVTKELARQLLLSAATP